MMKMKEVYKIINDGKARGILKTSIGDYEIEYINPSDWTVIVKNGDYTRTFYSTPDTKIQVIPKQIEADITLTSKN